MLYSLFSQIFQKTLIHSTSLPMTESTEDSQPPLLIQGNYKVTMTPANKKHLITNSQFSHFQRLLACISIWESDFTMNIDDNQFFFFTKLVFHC